MLILYLFIIIHLLKIILYLFYTQKISTGVNMLNEKSDFSRSQTMIAEGTRIDGKLYFPGSVKIEGEVTGDINTDNILTIGKKGKVQSTIKTKSAVISGDFKGDMHVSESVEITSTGKFIGNLIQDRAQLAIEKGGMFKGKSTVNGKS